jgi:hypothetical protein
MALLPLVIAHSKKKSKKKKKKTKRTPDEDVGLDAAAGDETTDSQGRSRTATGRSSETIGSGLVLLHAGPDGARARADGDVQADGAAGSQSEDSLKLAMSWRVSLNRGFVPSKPKTLMLPTVDDQIGSFTGTTLQMLRGQLQHDLLSAEGTQCSSACNVTDTRKIAVGTTGTGTQMRAEGAEGAEAGGGVSLSVSLSVKKVVPVCLWEANAA